MDKVPECISNSPATLICMNDLCNKPNPFICSTANHQCKQHHRTCLKLEWIIFKETLDQSRQMLNPTFKLLCDKVEKVITKGIEQLIVELNNFNKWKKQYGGMEKISEFYQSIQLSKESRWTGKDICQLKNDKKIKFDNLKIDNKKIDNVISEIETKKQEFIMLIKRLYGEQKIQPPQNVMKIKSKYLSDLNKKLEELKQRPEHLELKFGMNKLIHLQCMNELIMKLQINSKPYRSINDLICSGKLVYSQQCMNESLIMQWVLINNYVGVNSSIKSQSMIELIMQWQLVMIKIVYEQFDHIGVTICDHQEYLLILRSITTQLIYDQVATLLSNDKFRNLNTLTIYFSDWKLSNDKYFSMICASLMKLPKLKLFTIVVTQIETDASFRQLGNKFKAMIDKEWHKTEKW